MPPLIRLASEADAPALAAIYAPYVTESPVSFELEPPSSAEMAGRVRTLLETYPWLVCESGGRVLGYVYAGKHAERAAYRWSVDVTVYVEPAAQRQGVGRGLYTSLFNLLRLQGFQNAYAGITLPNDASVGLHESLGFQLVGVFQNVGFKLGRWHDVSYWGLALQSADREPEKPRALPDLVADPRFEAALTSGLELIRLAR